MAQVMMHGGGGGEGGRGESAAAAAAEAASHGANGNGPSAAPPASPQQHHEKEQGHPRHVSEGRDDLHHPYTSRDMMMPMMRQRPPTEPMFRKGLSMLGGLFGSNSHSQGYGIPPADHFSAPLQADPHFLRQQKKDAKLAMEYAKLGTFYCWRKLMDGQEAHYESFSIPNQKHIKKKLNKNPPQTLIMLAHREKKLQGEIMLDITQNRGCSLQKIGGKTILIQLEIKEENYTPNNDFVFANHPSSTN
ncbi:hypothetical protein BDF20DRAFT_865398 [Mycotypha africana]|uniref:uncharacterized protein n=1 Tax=Mycotypha africana TaxID=64632 RepID=UPI00230189AA|nr:uncharacterized protein BDF20DRAFT_865398 [Mycotypha africana]KAI8982181.1 hypothetical protein BDF20DRAFT_865398 [Mycotypha africana]